MGASKLCLMHGFTGQIWMQGMSGQHASPVWMRCQTLSLTIIKYVCLQCKMQQKLVEAISV